MFKKTLIATATAVVIGAASLGATATAASAAPSFGAALHGPGWTLKFGNYPKWNKPVVQKVCGPTFKTVKVWKPGRGLVWDKVYAGQSCHFEKVYPGKGYPHPKW